VIGAGGFIGSHAAEYYAMKGDHVIAVDNLSRQELLGRAGKITYNWEYIKKCKNVDLRILDITNLRKLVQVARKADMIIHAAAQTAVTASIENAYDDFKTNALGTFNVLEAARRSGSNPTMIYCSTNKVYGENINKIRILEKPTRYEFDGEYSSGIPEDFPIDLTGHTPYGCSKLSGDIYFQDYAHTYGLNTGVFRLSCIYGPRQFGVSDQGWLSWFTIATLTGRPITIYGDGKQVRDVLYVNDLVEAFDRFAKRSRNLRGEVFNLGGGPDNTLSLLELLDLLEEFTGKRSKCIYKPWRPSDQKVYVSNIGKANKLLDWRPRTCPRDGVKAVVEWTNNNLHLFARRSRYLKVR